MNSVMHPDDECRPVGAQHPPFAVGQGTTARGWEMTKYEPLTKQSDRKHVESLMLQRLPTTNIGNAAFAGFNSILADLAHAEACLQEREAEIERLEKKAGTLQGMLDTSLELEKTYCDSFGKVQAERDEAVILLQAFAGADDWELKPAIDAEDFLARIRAGEQPQQGGE